MKRHDQVLKGFEFVVSCLKAQHTPLRMKPEWIYGLEVPGRLGRIGPAIGSNNPKYQAKYKATTDPAPHRPPSKNYGAFFELDLKLL
jgi:hypothetical protein